MKFDPMNPQPPVTRSFIGDEHRTWSRPPTSPERHARARIRERGHDGGHDPPSTAELRQGAIDRTSSPRQAPGPVDGCGLGESLEALEVGRKQRADVLVAKVRHVAREVE